MGDYNKNINPAKTRISSAVVKRRVFFLLLFTALTGLLLTAGQAHAGKKNLYEYEIKAAFIYNFAKYVNWPKNTFKNPEEPLILGLLGDQPFGTKINKINGKMVHGHKLEVITIKDYKEIKQCHLLYISPSESEKMERVWPLLENKKILTISDMADFAATGGMIELIIINDKIRFIINPEAAEQAGLNVSSQLLKLAIIINQGSLK